MAKLDLAVNVSTRGTDQLEGIGDRLGRFGRNMTVGVTLPLIAAGGAAAAMASQAETSQARLQSVFDSTEAAAWTSVDALNAHAKALSEATTFDDDAVADAQAALLAFGSITGDQFTGATDAAADLAAFMGTDISDAAGALGKALADPEKGLGRLARQIGPLTDEQQQLLDSFIAVGDTAGAQQVILDAVGERIGTVAEDLAATTSGQMQQAMNQLGEAGEAIGVFLLPVLATLADWLQGAAKWFTDLDPAVQGFIVGFAAIVAAIGPVILIGSKLIGAFQLIIGAFNLLKVALLTNPFTALAVAVAAIAALIILNWDSIVAFFQGVWKAISDGFTALGKWIESVWKGIGEFIDTVADAIGDIGATIWKPIGDGFEAVIDFIRGVWNGFARFWNSIQITVPSVDIPLVGKVGGFTIGVPDLPMLAAGGIVTGPTLALIGEKGPEAVIPLDRMGAGGLTVEVNVLGDLRAEDPEQVAGAIGRVLWTQGISDAGLFAGGTT